MYFEGGSSGAFLINSSYGDIPHLALRVLFSNSHLSLPLFKVYIFIYLSDKMILRLAYAFFIQFLFRLTLPFILHSSITPVLYSFSFYNSSILPHSCPLSNVLLLHAHKGTPPPMVFFQLSGFHGSSQLNIKGLRI